MPKFKEKFREEKKEDVVGVLTNSRALYKWSEYTIAPSAHAHAS